MFEQSFYGSSLSALTPKTNSYFSNGIFQMSKRIISEKQIVTDLLRMLIGIPSEIFVKKKHSDEYQFPNNIQMDHLGTETIRNAVSEVNKTQNHLQYIQKENYRMYLHVKNPVVKDFCQGVFDYLQKLKNYFGTLLGQINLLSETVEKKITLMSLFNIISGKCFLAQFIIRCLNVCSLEQESKPQIVRLMNKLWEIEQQLLLFPQKIGQFLKIFKITLNSYFKNVQSWFKMKEIPESMDYFIIDPPKKHNLPQGFLHKNDQIDTLKLPIMFEAQSHGILEIGKIIRFISLYYEQHEKAKLVSFFEIQKQFSVLDQLLHTQEFKTFKRVKVEKLSMNQRLKQRTKKKTQKNVQQIPEDNPYEMFISVHDEFDLGKIPIRKKQQVEDNVQISIQERHEGFGFRVKGILAQILENINKRCLRFFKQEEGLGISSENRIKKSIMHALIGIKKFMLLEKGDFLLEFESCSEQILEKKKGLISHNKIYSFIDEALKKSSAKSLPQQILNNVYFDFKKKSTQKHANSLPLWFFFCFWYKQDGPITYIFTEEMMQKLKGISNFIFKLKKGQIILLKKWEGERYSKVSIEEAERIEKIDQKKIRLMSRKQQEEKNLNKIQQDEKEKRMRKQQQERKKKVKKSRGIIMSRAIALRNSLQAFFMSCLSHVFDSIEIIWTEYNKEIQDSSTVFQIIKQSVQMIQKLQKITTQNKLLCVAVTKVLLLLENFQKFWLLMEDLTIIIHLSEVEKMENQLKQIAEIAMMTSGLQEIVNYNNFYNRFQ